ncbi:MAG: hypothetical protein J3R72DRAFT_425041 [Linnemannia gamsii]|nr:MAG: hypothetical protein J3R72DRAFT_425041 [Linnemannia gamsii]
MISLPVLTAFLQASPQLLKLILAQFSYHVRQNDIPGYHEQSYWVVQQVGVHCHSLKSLHVSVCRSYGPVTDQEVNPIFEMFPNMKEFNFMDRDMLRPRFVNGLRTVANRITSLNLLPFGLDASGLRDVHLREILCIFHHLLHLRVPSTKYHIVDMELENIQRRTRENWEESRGYDSRRDSLAIATMEETRADRGYRCAFSVT